MSNLRRAVIVLLTFCATFRIVSPAQAQPSHYDLAGLKWRNVGPNRGGRSIAAASSTKRPFEYYFGATGGGLWKSTDGGASWNPVSDGQIKSSSVGAVAVSESDPDIVYIGMGETELRGSIIQGDGVYKSTDSGKTWSHIGLPDTQAIARIRIDPINPEVVYVAALGHPFGANEERGVFRSRDGGKTWQRVLFASGRAGAVDLSLDSHNPRTLFAAIWEAYRSPWMLSSGGPGSGLFKSTDGGDTWSEITRNPGLPSGIIGKIGVSISGADSNRVYALIEAEDGGLFRSDDAGATWTRVNEERKIRQRAFYFNRITADPKQRDTVYILNVQLYKSTDGGNTLTVIKTPHADNHDLWIAPEDPNRMINANDGGAVISVNGGRTWTQERYPTAQFYHVATTRDIPYHICGAQQDSTTACVPSDGGRNLRDPEAANGDWLYAVGGGEDGYVTPHPKNPNLFYAGSQAGILTRYDKATGQTRDIQVNPLFFSGIPAKALKERWQWVFPIVFSPKAPNTLYTSSQHLWKTTNDGQSWKRISPDLTRADPNTLGDSGGPITKDQNGPEIYGTIFTIAPSHFEPGTIWTGSDDGLVYITRDEGQDWKNVTPPDLPRFSRVSLIEASSHKPGTAYMAANRYELDDLKPYILRTDDYGGTWTKIVDGIADNDFVRAVREDSQRPGLLYAGTEHGVYFSLSNGAHWQSLSLDLPDTQVPDLVVEGNDLVIATHGRSFYVLDNIGILRQLTPQAFESDVYLFTPDMAVRSQRPAVIDYYLKRGTDSVTITILDTAGKAVQTATASAKEPDNVKTQLEPDSEDPPRPKPPGREAGINRFVWDLRHSGATVFEGMVLRGAHPERGPFALPGDYRVQLTVEGRSYTRPLTVAKDPRLTSLRDIDLEAQFKFAMDVRHKISQANELVMQIRKIKKQISDRLARVGDPKLVTAGTALEAKLNVVEEAIYQVHNRSARDTLNFPIRLNNQLAWLMEAVDLGDARPTDQMYSVYHDLSQQLAIQKRKMEEALKSDLAHLNQLLEGQKLEKIEGSSVPH